LVKFAFNPILTFRRLKINFKLIKNYSKTCLINQASQKAGQLLAELRANPDWAIEEKTFKQGYFKDLG